MLWWWPSSVHQQVLGGLYCQEMLCKRALKDVIRLDSYTRLDIEYCLESFAGLLKSLAWQRLPLCCCVVVCPSLRKIECITVSTRNWILSLFNMTSLLHALSRTYQRISSCSSLGDATVIMSPAIMWMPGRSPKHSWIFCWKSHWQTWCQKVAYSIVSSPPLGELKGYNLVAVFLIQNGK